MKQWLRYKNAYLILSKCFCYILPNLNQIQVGEVSLIFTNTTEISLRWQVLRFSIFWIPIKSPTVLVSNIRDLLFTGVQKSYGPEISRFLPCMLQVLENLRQLFIFSNYIAEIDQFTLDLLKRSDTYRWTFWRVFNLDHPKEDHKSVNVRL